ncbi:MAG: hypothetical protein H6737_18090 [Alphaproteobacteria bacterium]|nr:hypothetical protein [Alphaproteobacteria bacterium]
MNPQRIGLAVMASLGIALAAWVAIGPAETPDAAPVQPAPTEAAGVAPPRPGPSPAPSKTWEGVDANGEKIAPPEGWVPEKKPRPPGPAPSAEALRRAFDAIDWHPAANPEPGQDQRAFRNAYTDKIRAFSNLDRVLASVEGEGETEAKLEQVEIRLIMAELSLRAPFSPSEGRDDQAILEKRVRPLYDQATTLLDAIETADPGAADAVAALRQQIPTGSP